jgi:hypothetical protein
VDATKSALAATGVADASLAAVALADRAVEASGFVGMTRAAVAATGRALEATGRVAERTGAVDAALRVSEAAGATLAPALAASERALGAGLGATVAAADATLSGTLKAVAITGRAAEAIPQAVDLTGCVRACGDVRARRRDSARVACFSRVRYGRPSRVFRALKDATCLHARARSFPPRRRGAASRRTCRR